MDSETDNPLFESQLSPSNKPFAAGPTAKQYCAYKCVISACKEAYTKAVGVGICHQNMHQSVEEIHFEPEVPLQWHDASTEGHHMCRVYRRAIQNDVMRDSEVEGGMWCLSLKWIRGQHGMHAIVTACGAPKWCVDANGGFKAQLSNKHLCPQRASQGAFELSRLSISDIVPHLCIEPLQPTDICALDHYNRLRRLRKKPILRKSGYNTTPPLPKLQRMSLEQVRSVPHLCIEPLQPTETMPVHISDQQEAEIFEAVEAGVRAMILAKPPEFQANFPDPSDNLFAYGFTSQDITPMMNMLDKFQMVKPIQPVQVLQNFSIKGLAQLVTDACTH